MYCDWVLFPPLSSSQIHLDLPPHTITFIPSFCSLPSHCPSSPFLFLSLLISRHLLQLVLLEYSQELVLPWSVVNLLEVTLMKKADFLFQKLSNASSTSAEDDVIFPLYRLGFRLTWDRSGCCHNYSGLTTAVFCCLKKKTHFSLNSSVLTIILAMCVSSSKAVRGILKLHIPLNYPIKSHFKRREILNTMTMFFIHFLQTSLSGALK